MACKKIISIRNTLRRTYIIMIIALFVPLLFNVVCYQVVLNRYTKMIQGIEFAQNLSNVVRNDIGSTMWNVVSGRETYESSKAASLFEEINNELETLSEGASSSSNRKLILVAKNTMATIQKYVSDIIDNIEKDAPVTENEEILDDIRNHCELTYDILASYANAEIDSVAQQNQSLMTAQRIMHIFQLVIITLFTIFWLINYNTLNKRISKPISRLQKAAYAVMQGDLSIRVKPPEISELSDFTNTLNTMVAQIGDLIEQNLEKQKSLQKAEMQTLQAQIAPHFMYNTLDTIAFLAEVGKNNQAAKTTIALSNFYRTSLSKGKDWIPVAQEKGHVESYLQIQKVRYGAILTYEIAIEPAIEHEMILKLLLQPLVENAIYHGIKNTRRRGHIRITGEAAEDFLVFAVEDNGSGMNQKQLQNLLLRLKNHEKTDSSSGFGLYNICKRIHLYYQTDDFIEITSEEGKGTKVTLRLRRHMRK